MHSASSPRAICLASSAIGQILTAIQSELESKSDHIRVEIWPNHGHHRLWCGDHDWAEFQSQSQWNLTEIRIQSNFNWIAVRIRPDRCRNPTWSQSNFSWIAARFRPDRRWNMAGLRSNSGPIAVGIRPDRTRDITIDSNRDPLEIRLRSNGTDAR